MHGQATSPESAPRIGYEPEADSAEGVTLRTLSSTTHGSPAEGSVASLVGDALSISRDDARRPFRASG